MYLEPNTWGTGVVAAAPLRGTSRGLLGALSRASRGTALAQLPALTTTATKPNKRVAVNLRKAFVRKEKKKGV